MDNFYTRQNTILETGEILPSELEIEITRRLHATYGVSVLCSEFVLTVGDMRQGRLYAMIDTRNSGNETMRKLSKLKGAGSGGLNLTSPAYAQEFRAFGDRLLEEYFAVSGSDATVCNELFVIVYVFEAYAKNWLYSWTWKEVKRFFHKYYFIGIRDVVGVEDGIYYVLADYMEDFRSMVEEKSSIIDRVYHMMEVHDRFHLLKKEDVRISFLLKSALDETELNYYLRRRTLT